MSKDVIKELCTSTTADVMAKELRSIPTAVELRPDVEEDHIDTDPITPEEEADLKISMDELKRGKYTVVPSTCTDEELFEILRGERGV
jgi:uncharacterized membrane protein YkoI